jgi:predicted dithiol-disulfide oxidoreductase (DUF899 family)
MRRRSCDVDPVESVLVHLQNHDVNDTFVALAQVDEFGDVRKRDAFRFAWVTWYLSEISSEFNASFLPVEVAPRVTS